MGATGNLPAQREGGDDGMRTVAALARGEDHIAAHLVMVMGGEEFTRLRALARRLDELTEREWSARRRAELYGAGAAMTGPSGVDTPAAPVERLTDGFRAFVAASQGDRERARAILRGMPLVKLRHLAEVLDDLAGEVDLAENATWQETARLARECQQAGLVVVKLQPRHGGGTLTLDVSLWYPVEDRLQIWAEGRGEDAATVREHIAHYRDAQAEALG